MNAPTAKKLKFAQDVFSGLSAEQARINAGYKDASNKGVVASQLTHDPIVMAEMQRLANHHAARAEKLFEVLLTRFEAAAAVDPTALLKDDETDGTTFDIEGAKKLGILKHLRKIKIKRAMGEKGPERAEVESIELINYVTVWDRMSKAFGWNSAEKIEIEGGTPDVQALSTDEIRALLKEEIAASTPIVPIPPVTPANAVKPKPAPRVKPPAPKRRARL